jgi:ketosteroid isomerase-like protein
MAPRRIEIDPSRAVSEVETLARRWPALGRDPGADIDLPITPAQFGGGRTSSWDRLAGLARQAPKERAFAKTMADRDHGAFASFISDEGIFWGQKAVLRGRTQVAEGWKAFFDGPQAPFSWEPARVEVLDSGTLALSSGPVREPGGKVIGTFNSIWRLEFDGRWRVIFDKGSPPQ